MTSPQLEDGYTRISNDLVVALCRFRIPGEVMQIVLSVIRFTYGWNKKTEHIPLLKFHLSTGMKKPSIVRAVKKALEHRIIYISANGEHGFMKDFAQWKPFTKELIVSTYVNTPFTKKLTNGVPFNVVKDTKDIKTSVFDFEALWSKYPEKDGKKDALRHFIATVKTDQDWKDINTALEKYLACDKVKKGFIKNGSTWFNNWRDWINYTKKGGDIW